MTQLPSILTATLVERENLPKPVIKDNKLPSIIAAALSRL